MNRELSGMKGFARAAGAVAAVVALAFGLQAFSPGLAGASPSDLPDKSQSASLTIHKYVLPDEVPPGPEADGSEGSAKDVPAQAVPLEGVEFQIVRAYSAGEAKALVSQGSAVESDFTPAGQPGDEIEGYLVRSGDETHSQVTNADGLARFDLTGHLGTYLVQEQPDPRVELPAAPFIASVPMPDPADASAWLYDVHVYPKNYELDIDKGIVGEGGEIMQDANAVGEKNTFRIEADIPVNIGQSRSYVVTDLLDWRLTTTSPSPEDCVVTVAGVRLDPTRDYTAVVSAATDDEGRACQLVTWDFTPGLARLQQLVSKDDLPGARRVRIEFVARLNDNAVHGTLDNGATLTVVNKAGSEHRVDSDRPTLSYAAIRVVKSTFDDEAVRLAGASFRIAASLVDARAQAWMHRLSDTGADLGVWEVTTGDDGLATFGGLDFDLTSGTDYWLVEVSAPEGYQAMTEPVRVHVGPGGGSNQAGLLVEALVLNSPVPELPATGGTGTALPLVGSCMLAAGGVAGAAALISSRRRGR